MFEKWWARPGTEEDPELREVAHIAILDGLCFHMLPPGYVGDFESRNAGKRPQTGDLYIEPGTGRTA